MTVPVDRDQLRALAVLRYWFGDLEVIEIREGVEGEGQPSPWLASQQLSLTIEARPAHVDPPVRPGSRPARRAKTLPG
jgi:hypothetical protein